MKWENLWKIKTNIFEEELTFKLLDLISSNPTSFKINHFIVTYKDKKYQQFLKIFFICFSYKISSIYFPLNSKTPLKLIISLQLIVSHSALQYISCSFYKYKN